MWEVVICDSDKSFATELEDHVRDFYQDRKLETNVQIYTEGAAFRRDLDERKMDLIFLNTRLSDVHGYEIAREIRNHEEKKEASLIFLSDHDEDVFEAFSYQPVAYMRKMHSEQELEKILCRLWGMKHAGRSITVRHQRTHKLLRIQDIMYLESQGHYISVHCVDGESYRFRGRMAEYEEMLQGCFFVHSAKSYLINCAYIESVGENVKLNNGITVPCSKSRKSEVRKVCEFYLKDVSSML